MSERPCKACGMKIEMIEGPNGKHIPAQRIRTVYQRIDLDHSSHLRKADIAQAQGDPYPPVLYVSHFETCPHADSFSRKTPPAAQSD